MSRANLFSLAALILIPALASGSEFGYAPFPVPPVIISGQAPADAADAFRAGVNLPWHNYGIDFGSAPGWENYGVSSPHVRPLVEAEFAMLKSKGVRLVRWFLMCDGRAAPEFDAQGQVAGLEPAFYTDLDAALEIAQANDIQLILVLFDYRLLDAPTWWQGVQMGGHGNLLTDSAAQDSLFNNVLVPLFDSYGKHPAILAWEVMNEPEMSPRFPGYPNFSVQLYAGGKIVDAAQSINIPALRAFSKRVVDAVHARTNQLVTLGAGKRSYLPLWKGLGLDFYQYHYYDYMEAAEPLSVRYSDLGLDKPCVLGEFPTQGTARSLESFLDTARGNGLAGAWAWSLRAADGFSDFTSVADRFSAWTGRPPRR